MVLISAESPSGDTSKGTVETLETARFVVSPTTFAEITDLFVRTLAAMKAQGIYGVDESAHDGGAPDGQLSINAFTLSDTSHHKH